MEATHPVLIADGQRCLIQRLRNVIASRSGGQIAVRLATDTAMARASLAASPPELAILGSELLENGAAELIRAHSRAPSFRGCRFMALADKTDDALAAALIELGANGGATCLPRSVDPEKLAVRMAEYLAFRDARPGASGPRDILIAPPDRRPHIHADLEHATKGVVAIAENVDFAVLVARSAAVRAIFVVEPVPRWTCSAIIEYVRAEGCAAAVVRIGEGASEHPQLFNLAPELRPGDIAVLEDRLSRARPGEPVNADTMAARPRVRRPAATPEAPVAATARSAAA